MTAIDRTAYPRPGERLTREELDTRYSLSESDHAFIRHYRPKRCRPPDAGGAAEGAPGSRLLPGAAGHSLRYRGTSGVAARADRSASDPH
jgi:hypothetical protein